jgi:hypothetical protein
LVGGALAGGASAIAYLKSDKINNDVIWYKKEIAKENTAIRKAIDIFEKIRQEELKKAKNGEDINLASIKKAYSDVVKISRKAAKEYLKQEKINKKKEILDKNKES